MKENRIDMLQNRLVKEVFADRKSPKKAAGRALGTFLEVITYYLLRNWGLTENIAIETRLPEFAAEGITHNVEYSLHPIIEKQNVVHHISDGTLTSAKLRTLLDSLQHKPVNSFDLNKSATVIKDGVVKNSAIVSIRARHRIHAHLLEVNAEDANLSLALCSTQPFAFVECKRVGVQEGLQKGPQSIEKAKQGAYVALKASALQKITNNSGGYMGIVFEPNGEFQIKEYNTLLKRIVQSPASAIHKNFVMSIGVVSNHGNWFGDGQLFKEMVILKNAYDWLLFLKDEGMIQFVEDLILDLHTVHKSIRRAFFESYGKDKKINSFTKVSMDIDAHLELEAYFRENHDSILNWFDVVTEGRTSLLELREDLYLLKQKQWSEIL